MTYRQTYFRIRTEGYQSSWTDEAAENSFREESRALFQSAGWTLHAEQIGSGFCDTVTKENQDLYLHPQSFSGVIREDEVQPLRELLSKARSFQCYHIDFYEEYLDITDEEYLSFLESRRKEIADTILELCKTKRSNLYIVSSNPIAMDIAERFALRRVCDKENHRNIAAQFVGGLISELVERGLLVTAETTDGEGIRSATEKERRALGLLPEEPDPLGNMTMAGW